MAQDAGVTLHHQHRPTLLLLYGDGDDGGQLPDGRRFVLLESHEPSQDVVSVSGPAEDVCVLEPRRNVALRTTQFDRINNTSW